MFRAPAVTLLLIFGCSAQTRVSIEPRARPEVKTVRPATFRLDAKLVEIPVTVTDAHDHPRMHLQQSDFRVFEDGVEQEIAAFSMADAAVSTGVVFDASGSMRGRIEDSREALKLLLRTSSPPDEFSLVRFSDRPEMITPLTHDAAEISRTLGMVEPHGWTALYDAIFLSVQEMRRATNPRRALLVLSDGEDNNSRFTQGEALSLVREADVRVYAIGLFRQTHCLERMAEETGGRMIWVRKLSELPDAVQKLTDEMRNVYVVSYFSRNPATDGKYRKVKVEVQPKSPGEPLRVSWRHGYFETNR